MKKPNYIRVEIARGKSTLSPAVKRYFSALKKKECVVKYGRMRYRKEFKYTILRVVDQEEWNWNTDKKTRVFMLEIELQKEEE